MIINIRKYKSEDWKKVSEIYRQGINTKNATFEATLPEQNEWEAKQIPGCILIAEFENEIAGWASLSGVSTREVYKGVSEVSVYVSTAQLGIGIGKRLLTKLISVSEENGIWTMQAGIFPENEASIKLHLSCGFREVGYREKIGMMDGVWRDTVLFERRSKTIY